MSGAALLLFGKNPQRFFQRARVRFIRYDGTEAKVGTEMNVIKDEIFHGRILDVVRQALDFVSSQIKMFDDRITVESPGSLPGIVRLNNLRTVHFSRNPKIAEFLHQYEYVKEFGEGIDRMFHEMENAGLPAPEYSDNAFMLNATIRNGEINGEINSDIGELNPALLYLNKNESAVYHLIEEIPQISRQKMAEKIGVSSRTIDRTIQSLIKKNLIRRKGSKKTGHWEIIE